MPGGKKGGLTLGPPGLPTQWAKQRRAEERGSRSRSSREYIYSDRVNFSDVGPEILPSGYAHASGDGRYTLDKFAQLPWNGSVQMLFGQVDGYCERHGFR